MASAAASDHRSCVVVLVVADLGKETIGAVCLCVCVRALVAIVRGERTGVLISCLLAVLSVVAEDGV